MEVRNLGSMRCHSSKSLCFTASNSCFLRSSQMDSHWVEACGEWSRPRPLLQGLNYFPFAFAFSTKALTWRLPSAEQ